MDSTDIVTDAMHSEERISSTEGCRALLASYQLCIDTTSLKAL